MVRQQKALYEALVHLDHLRRCRQAPSPEPKAIYQLRWSCGGEGRRAKEGRRGKGGGVAASPVEEHRGRK